MPDEALHSKHTNRSVAELDELQREQETSALQQPWPPQGESITISNSKEVITEPAVLIDAHGLSQARLG